MESKKRDRILQNQRGDPSIVGTSLLKVWNPRGKVFTTIRRYLDSGWLYRFIPRDGDYQLLGFVCTHRRSFFRFERVPSNGDIVKTTSKPSIEAVYVRGTLSPRIRMIEDNGTVNLAVRRVITGYMLANAGALQRRRLISIQVEEHATMFGINGGTND